MQLSKNAQIFCLIHKMDLLSENVRDSVFRTREAELKKVSHPMKITCYKTSIWDETLYKAWSSIVYSLIPNVKTLEAHLDNFTKICGADEVVLFERATFLVIAHSSMKDHPDVHRFEKISNYIKQFKLSCRKAGLQFSSMEINNKEFTAFIESFTPSTYIMVIVSDQNIRKYLFLN
jgi:Ras-related GTP-binding protein A/B